MYGFELQTNANLFQTGVKEREIAFQHSGRLFTLEGDETHDHPDKSELEFVTAPCATPQQARLAADSARKLADALKHDWATVPKDGHLTFRAGQEYADGTWTRDCTITLANPDFHAQPQVTVGIPLTALTTFMCTALTEIGQADIAKDLQDGWSLARDVLVRSGMPKPPDEVLGFLTACHYFAIRAMNANPVNVAVDPAGQPVSKDKSRHGSYLNFSFDSDYLYGTPAFQAGPEPAVRLQVNRDSPKSAFQILHRTDYYAMFHMIPAEMRLAIPPATWQVLLWPWDLTGKTDFTLFPFPYRADPHDGTPDVARFGPGGGSTPARRYGVGWKDEFGDTTRETADWYLMEHGPTLRDWWDSVVNGRLVDGRSGLRLEKDLASPPPGLRGRKPDNLAHFPSTSENKSEFYSMGAFPRDTSGSVPLAVFEFRALAQATSLNGLMKPNRLVAAADWPTLVDRFCAGYVKF